MEFKDLIKMERELTGTTQEALAERLNEKYHTSITPRIINTIESKGVIADANLRNVLLEDFYMLDIEREGKILTFAYNLADYITDRKVKIDLRKLFSFTCKDELIQYIDSLFQESKKDKKNGSFLLDVIEDSIRDRLNEFIRTELDDISDEIEVVFMFSSNIHDTKLNDSAKLVLYIAYYYILLREKKKSKKEKNLISKDDFDKPGFKEIFYLCYPKGDIDKLDIDKLSETSKGRVITYINNRISCLCSIVFGGEDKKDKDFVKFFLEILTDFVDIFPQKIEGIPENEVKEILGNLYRAKTLLESVLNVDFKRIDYENESFKLIVEAASKSNVQNSFSAKDMLNFYYSIYQAQTPSIVMVNKISEQLIEKKYFSLDKLKNTAEQSIEKEDQGSNKLKETAEQLVKDLNEKYEKYKGNFTEDQFYEFVYQQKYLFQLYKKHNTLHFYFERLKNIQQ